MKGATQSTGVAGREWYPVGVSRKNSKQREVTGPDWSLVHTMFV
jgi:hypothetical protein